MHLVADMSPLPKSRHSIVEVRMLVMNWISQNILPLPPV